MIRVKLVKTLDPEKMPLGRTGWADKWEPPGIVMVDWDFYYAIPMYYNEIERI